MKITPQKTALLLLLFTALPASAENNLTITAGTNTNVTAGPDFTTTGDSALLTPLSITSLWSGANVSVVTGAGGANSQPGTITIDQAISTTTTFDLLIQATSDLLVNAGGIFSNGTGGINLQAGDLLTTTPDLTTIGGAISLGAGLDLHLGGSISTASDAGSGHITLTSTTGEVIALGDINAGGLTTDGAAGDVTITAAIRIQAANITAASQGSHGGAVFLQGSLIELYGDVDVSSQGPGSNAGSIELDADDVLGDGKLLANSISGTGGAVTITASGGSYGIAISSGNGLIDTSGSIQGGDVTLTAMAGGVEAGYHITTGSLSTQGLAGNVTITAQDQITTGIISAGSQNNHGGAILVQSFGGGIHIQSDGSYISAASQGGNAGSIELDAAVDVLVDDDLYADALSGHGGAVTITAGGASGILLDGTIDTSGGIQGGDITLTATMGDVWTGATITAGWMSTSGTAGNVTITAQNQITTGTITAGSMNGDGGVVLLQSLGGGIQIGGGDYIAVSSGSGVNAGSIELDAAEDVLVDGDLYADAPSGHGGAVTITAGGTPGITLNGTIDTSGGILGGDITLTATTGTVWTGPTITAGWMSTSGTAGNVTITAQNQITTGTITAGSMSGNGGAVLLQSLGGGIQIGSGKYIAVSSGSGVNAGSIELNAAEDVLVNGDLHADAPAGHGGAVTITAGGTPGITLDGTIDTSGGIQGGDIMLTATTGTVWTGSTITTGWMSTSGTAGNVTITAQNRITTGTITAGSMNGNGGVVLLQSLGGGIQIGGGDYIGVSSGSGANAGSIELNAAEDVLMDGNLHADAPAGHGGAVTITAGGVSGITSNGMIDTSGGILGGDITLTAPTVYVANMTTTVSAIQILSQTVTLGQVQADGTFHIAPQIGETSTDVELNGAILGGVELDFDLGSTGSLLVASGATLAGSGTIDGTTTILGALAPGSSPGTLTFTGNVDLTAAESFVFELGVPASDQVVLTLGTLSIDSLGLDDFIFSDAGGFVPGDYVLFDSNNTIVGSLDPTQTIGTVLGLPAELKLTNGGQDITVSIVPEPGSAALLLGGCALLLGARCRRA